MTPDKIKEKWGRITNEQLQLTVKEQQSKITVLEEKVAWVGKSL